MKKVIHSIILILTITSATAQSWTPPVLPKTGKTISAFVPKGYTIIDSTTGDLNNDKQPDMAFVIQAKDTFDEVRRDSTDKIHSTPRILVALLRQNTTYKLVLQQNTFILRYGEGGMDPEPFDKIEIDSSLLDIRFQFGRANAEYKLRFQSGSFDLIWASDGYVAGDEFNGWEFDFLTKKAIHSWGRIDEDTRFNEEIKEIKMATLKKLSNMLMPYTWEVLPGITI